MHKCWAPAKGLIPESPPMGFKVCHCQENMSPSKRTPKILKGCILLQDSVMSTIVLPNNCNCCMASLKFISIHKVHSMNLVDIAIISLVYISQGWKTAEEDTVSDQALARKRSVVWIYNIIMS